MTLRLAVIPARGGSKRVPRKNIRPFAGKPMLAYAIAGAKESGVFDRIVVSTDDEEIAAAAESLGAEVPFRRPAALSDDHAGTVEVVAHAIAELAAEGWHADQVCCIYACVPMLEAGDLREALSLLEAGDDHYAFPVAPFPSAVQRALLRDAAGRVAPLDSVATLSRSQDLAPAYYDAGQFYWGRSAAWTAGEHPHLHGRALVLPAWRVVDIDTPDDWLRAEALHAAMATRRTAAVTA